MTTFIKKSFTVFLMALAFMFIVGDLVHVGDLTIDNSIIETSKNYNGYISINNDEKIKQFVDLRTDVQVSYIDSTIILEGDITQNYTTILQIFEHMIIYEGYYDGVLLNAITLNISIAPNGLMSLSILLIDGNIFYYTNEVGFYLIIYLKSNYEVTP